MAHIFFLFFSHNKTHNNYKGTKGEEEKIFYIKYLVQPFALKYLPVIQKIK